jgi:HAD superfamily hydrolase (TIGR01509 family)
VKPKTIDAAIFDLDGLLVDSEPLAAMAMARFLESFGLQVDPAIQGQLLGRRLVEAIAIARDGYTLPGTVEELADRYGQLRMEALRGAVRPMPGARESVEQLRALDLRVGLATSGMRAHVDVSLEETGLAGLFDIEATGDEVMRGKPAPDLFLLAASRLGVDPDRTVVLEDSPLGVEAAIAAGMRAAAVIGGRPAPPAFPVAPTVTTATLLEAADWISRQ